MGKNCFKFRLFRAIGQLISGFKVLLKEYFEKVLPSRYIYVNFV